LATELGEERCQSENGRNLKFHLHEAVAPTQTIDELLEEIG